MAKPSKPLLSPAFLEFVSHLDADERARVTELRANSPQESDRRF
jgi:hypothetical protein